METQPTRFCIAHVCSRYIHTYAIAVQHQSKIISPIWAWYRLPPKMGPIHPPN